MMFNLISRVPIMFIILNIIFQGSMCMDRSVRLGPKLAEQFRAELEKLAFFDPTQLPAPDSPSGETAKISGGATKSTKLPCIDPIQFPAAGHYAMKTLNKIRSSNKPNNLVPDKYGVYASKDLGITPIMGYASESVNKLVTRLAHHKARLSAQQFDRFVVNRFSKPGLVNGREHSHRDTHTALYNAALSHRPGCIMVLLDHGADPREVYRKAEKRAGEDVVVGRMSALEAAASQTDVKGNKQVCIDMLKHAEATWGAVQSNPAEVKRVQGERSAIYKQWRDVRHN